uniref:Uncharacterized protein n=1 Tax=viral metagenome TaxID=1070528 RepID=A0A6C0EQD6_9ZZZZ
MNNYIYIHICCINNYKEIFEDLIKVIKDSKLYDIVTEIRCCVLGECDNSIFNDKIILRMSSNDLSLYEIFTINIIQEDSKNEDFNVLYLHTKGVTKPNNMFIKSWVDYMCYFNIYNYIKCLELLEYNDTVGVNLQDFIRFHYGGNFWWSKSSYINKLNKCINYCYNAPEFWLTENKNGKYVSLWNSNCLHYEENYPKELYESKLITPCIYDFTN